MKNHEKYTAKVYDCAPKGSRITAPEISYILDHYSDGAGRVIEGWKLGFMMAYNAAKRQRLDFQKK